MLVALRKESVDRNRTHPHQKRVCTVALRKESVDRNHAMMLISTVRLPVALRKESVDRNTQATPVLPLPIKSLSARRAWIEILVLAAVAAPLAGRSPQGERG